MLVDPEDRGVTPSPAATEAGNAVSVPSFPIVGIGASAGGLEAVSLLLRDLPANPGMAFVLVQHLDPAHESSLVSLLSRVATMPVTEAVDQTPVEKDHVYVVPPNAAIFLRMGRLHITPRGTTPQPLRLIDQFLQSLAEEGVGQRIGIILSGTGTDGTRGLEAIKAEGGITFAQDATAGHDGMPQSAIAAGCVDFVLSPKGIAHELLRLASPAFVTSGGSAARIEPATSVEADSLSTLFDLLRVSSGVDFSHYKQPTVVRRINRRMLVNRMERLADYLAFVQMNPCEAQALYEDILIHVTSFFRDPEMFAALKEVAFPAMMAGRSASTPIRIWVPGCSTGEEVYSLAICLLEFLGARAVNTPIKLFGTDISESVVARARTGVYRHGVTADISAERLSRFFVAVDDGYQVSKSVRECCVFARQDATRDPPFSNLDLISCRNVLIYLGPVLQGRVLPVFHHALREGGYLLLGRSEAVGTSKDLFSVVDSRHGIHVRKSVASRTRFDMRSVRREAEGSVSGARGGAQATNGRDMQLEADRMMLARNPAGVLVDDTMSILQFRGDTGPFLSPAAGTPTHDLLKMTREGLLPDLRMAIDEAKRHDAAVRKDGLQVKADGRWRNVSVEVLPVHLPASRQRSFLVLFEESGAPPEHAADPGRQAGDESAREETPADDLDLAPLQRELSAAREHLRVVIEEHEASTEALETANEEILSSNEELQSTNEELETAKEELQATNEELTTVNEELQRRNVEATQLSDDLTNLLSSVSIPMIMLGRDLTVRRFTPSAGRLLNLIASDVGRPFTDLKPTMLVPDLEQMLLGVVRTLEVEEREVQSHEGYWHRLRIRPYRTVDDRIDGAVMSLTDIDAMKRSEQRIEEARDYAENIVTTVREPLVVLDTELHVKTANRAFHAAFRSLPADVEGKPFCCGGDGLWDIPELRMRLVTLMVTGIPFEDLEVEADLPLVGRRALRMNARRVHGTGPGGRLILVGIADVTDRNRDQAEKRLLERKVQETQKLESLGILAGGIAHDFNNILTGILGHANLAELDAAPSSALRLHLRHIDEGVRRAADLCSQMLAYSGRGQFVVARCDLSALVKDATRLVQLAVSKHAVLHFDLAADLPAVMADSTQIRQVIMNLVVNASEAIGDAGGIITISTGTMHADRAYLSGAALSTAIPEGMYAFMEVADEGMGMSAETIERIFDPFFTTKFTGRGLGLAAVLGIVRGHGGALRVASEPGEGSVFRLLLPCVEGHVDVVESPAVTIPAWRGDGSVLVVDDEDGVRGVTATLLESLGFQVVQASGGFEALTAFSSHAGKFRLVLLDMTMPQLSGQETYAELRKVKADVRVILMSGYSEQETLQRFGAGSLAGFLHKPFGMSELVTKLQAALPDD